MITTKPNPPLGPYPQRLLCGQVGMTPISIRISTINSMVPKPMGFSLALRVGLVGRLGRHHDHRGGIAGRAGLALIARFTLFAGGALVAG